MVMNPKNNKVEQIIKIGRTLANEYRIKILEFCKSEPNSITDIQKKINIAYPHVHNHIKILAEAGMVQTNTEISQKGKVVMVKALWEITEDGSLRKL